MDLFDHVEEGDLDYIKKVKADVLLDARDEDRSSVLAAALFYDKFDCCKMILKKCPSLLYFQQDSKQTLLHDAAGLGGYMFIDYFLSVGLDAATNEKGNMVRFRKWIRLKNKDKHTALTITNFHGNLHIVKMLVEVDRDYKLGLSEIPGYKGMTALQYAVENQDYEMIKLLTDEGDPYSDYIPYSIAMDLFDHVKKGDLDYVKTVGLDVLLKSRDKDRNSALGIGTDCNQLGCCEEILKSCPILLYHHNRFNETVLHYATILSSIKKRVKKEYYKLIDLFVGVGLDAATIKGDVESNDENMQHFKNWINLLNMKNETALIHAIYICNHDIVKRFLQVDRQYELGLSEITCYGRTPLQIALQYKDQEMIKLLTEGTDLDLEHGANTDGNMSLLIATEQAKEALHTGNNSDSADNTHYIPKIHFIIIIHHSIYYFLLRIDLQ